MNVYVQPHQGVAAVILRLMKSLLGSILVFFLINSLVNETAEAARITKVKGKKVMISLDGLQVEAGDTVYGIRRGKKRKAIIKITKVRGNKAVGRVKKGKPRKKMSIIAKKSKRRRRKTQKPRYTETQTTETMEPPSEGRVGKFSIGVLGGYGIDSMTVTLAKQATPTNKEDVAMTGSGMSVRLVGDYRFSEAIGVRLMTGLETFAVEGTATQVVCGTETTTACTADISFFTFDGLFQYHFLKGSFGMWAGLGAGLFSPSTFETNSLDSGSISTTSAFYFALGADIEISPTMYIPLQFDYDFFPPSSTVSTSIIAIRAGLMIVF